MYLHKEADPNPSIRQRHERNAQRAIEGFSLGKPNKQILQWFDERYALGLNLSGNPQVEAKLITIRKALDKKFGHLVNIVFFSYDKFRRDREAGVFDKAFVREEVPVMHKSSLPRRRSRGILAPVAATII